MADVWRVPSADGDDDNDNFQDEDDNDEDEDCDDGPILVDKNICA